MRCAQAFSADRKKRFFRDFLFPPFFAYVLFTISIRWCIRALWTPLIHGHLVIIFLFIAGLLWDGRISLMTTRMKIRVRNISVYFEPHRKRYVPNYLIGTAFGLASGITLILTKFGLTFGTTFRPHLVSPVAWPFFLSVGPNDHIWSQWSVGVGKHNSLTILLPLTSLCHVFSPCPNEPFLMSK